MQQNCGDREGEKESRHQAGDGLQHGFPSAASRLQLEIGLQVKGWAADMPANALTPGRGGERNPFPCEILLLRMRPSSTRLKRASGSIPSIMCCKAAARSKCSGC